VYDREGPFFRDFLRAAQVDGKCAEKRFGRFLMEFAIGHYEEIGESGFLDEIWRGIPGNGIGMELRETTGFITNLGSDDRFSLNSHISL
jgi:hypothetical protein